MRGPLLVLTTGLLWGCTLIPLDVCREVGCDGPKWVEVVAGLNFSCALDDQGSVSCWGDDLGDAFQPPTGSGFERIYAGYFHLCFERGDQLDCTGPSVAGEVVSRIGPFTSVAAGDQATCWITDDYTADCVGRVPAPPETDPDDTGGSPIVWGRIAVGSGHACGLAGTQQFCWGANDDGESDPPSFPASELALGRGFSCAMSASGVLKCWGVDNLGQTDAPLGSYDSFAAGQDGVCALDDGQPVCPLPMPRLGGVTPSSHRPPCAECGPPPSLPHPAVPSRRPRAGRFG